MTVQCRCFGSRSIVRALLTSTPNEVNIQLNAQIVLLTWKCLWYELDLKMGVSQC